MSAQANPWPFHFQDIDPHATRRKLQELKVSTPELKTKEDIARAAAWFGAAPTKPDVAAPPRKGGTVLW